LLNGTIFTVEIGDELGIYSEPIGPAKAYSSAWDKVVAEQLADLE